MAGLAIISLILLTSALVALLFMSRNMFTTRSQVTKNKKQYRTQPGSFGMSTVSQPKYQQVTSTAQKITRSEAVLGEPHLIQRKLLLNNS